MSKVTFYIAASYPRKAEALTIAKNLRSHGFKCSARWLAIEEGYEKGIPPVGEQDFYDIAVSDVFIGLIGDDLSHGGRDVELGYALGRKKMIFLIGEPQNPFHLLGRIVTVTELLNALKSL